MAKYEIEGIDELAEDFTRMAAIATAAVPLMLEAGADVLVEAHKREAAKLNISGRSKGALVRSIKKDKVKSLGGTKYIEVFPHGVDRNHTKKGVRNAEKGFVLHYGRSNMPGVPWMETGNQLSENDVVEAQRRVWGEQNASG